MGPIEQELRCRYDWIDDQTNWLSFGAFSVLFDAEVSLGLEGPVRNTALNRRAAKRLYGMWPDIWSEAIEAAEALKL